MIEEQFATAPEARSAIAALNPLERAKLLAIARVFVRSAGGRLEAGDLLHDAIVKTLDGTRRWSRQVSIIKHLDRVMESDAGHARRKARRSRPLEEPDLERPDEAALARELAEEQLADILPTLAKDPQLLRVLSLKAEGYSPAEVRATTGMSDTEYDTVGRRLRRLRERLLNGGE